MDHTTVIPRRVVYIVSEDLVKIASLLPSNANRSLLVHSLVLSLGLLAAGSTHHAHIVRPGRASREDIAAYHDTEYVDFVLNPRNSVAGVVTDEHIRFGLEDDCPAFRGMPLYVATIAGGALTAARALRAESANVNVAIFWDGGRHHAQKSQASGFCYIADAVLTMLALARPLPIVYHSLPNADLDVDSNSRPAPKTQSRRPRVVYLDLDVHFGDGVAGAFHRPGRGESGATSNILTLSIHHAAPGFFPNNPLAGLPRPPRPTASLPILSSSSSDPVLPSPPTVQPHRHQPESEPEPLQSQPHSERRVSFAIPAEGDDDDLYGTTNPRGGSQDDLDAYADWDEDWDPYTLSVPLTAGTSCRTMARVWRTVIEAVRRAFAPDFLVLQCGADGLAGDPCGVWNWSAGGQAGNDDRRDGFEGPEEGSMGWCVQQACAWGCKVLLTGGGGYHSPNVARTYAYLTSIAIGKPLARAQSIPDHTHYLAYAPSFTMDVPPGNMRDQNTQEHIWEVERVFAQVAQVIETRRLSWGK